MSRVEIIDQEYRLQPQDLAGTPRRLVITNVTLQGVEEMTPMLHFEGHTKRLALTAEQSRALIELTGTPVLRDWIGATLILEPRHTPDGLVIHIAAPTQHRPKSAMPAPISEDQRNWRFALVVVALLLLLSTLYSYLNLDLLLDALSRLRDLLTS